MPQKFLKMKYKYWDVILNCLECEGANSFLQNLFPGEISDLFSFKMRTKQLSLFLLFRDSSLPQTADLGHVISLKKMKHF